MFPLFQYFILHAIILFTSCSSATLTTAAAVNSGCGVINIRVPRIVGGDSSLSGSWPWMVSLRRLSDGVYKHHCGASLISDHWAITAAHCFHTSEDGFHWRARLGDYRTSSLERGEYDSDVVLVLLHPLFNASHHGNDIALVRLATSPKLKNTTPICLPPPHRDIVRDGSGCYVAGWGDTRGTGDQAKLRQVQLPVIDKDECSMWYNETITPDAFCAGYVHGGRDSCKGDSGGPYMCPLNGMWVLGGVVSWGKDCGATHLPGVYTSVEFHLHWVYHVVASYDLILPL